MISKEQLNKIKEFGIELDWKAAFGGKSSGNRHLFRIVKKAKELAKDYDVDISIIEAGAWLHDTNLEKTIAGDSLANKEKVQTFLKQIGLEEKQIEMILFCIESHDGRKPAKIMEAKIVHDADTLEKSGPLGVIRETWKRSQLGWNSEKIINHLEKHLLKRMSSLYLKESRIKAMKLNNQLKPFFKTLIKQIQE